ncbi:MAG: HPF/RaiA family ribosome-associated protein [Chitinophagales bacterium]|nr:HPF/RaiA family ribosome-associated protein [Chitinophagales bacterium]
MDIIIQSLGFTAGEKLEAHVKEKLEKLILQDRIVRAHVTLFFGPDRSVRTATCEIRLEMPGNDPFVKESSYEFEQSIDAAVDTLQAILRKAKEKLEDQRHHGISN